MKITPEIHTTKELGPILRGENSSYLYQVKLGDSLRVYMEARRCLAYNWVTIVEAQEFAARIDRRQFSDSMSGESGFAANFDGFYKLTKHNIDGWLRGIADPFDVPQVVIDNKQEIFFTDGRARTAWLLSSGAKTFPVSCCTPEMANSLKDACGVGWHDPVSIKQLIPLSMVGYITGDHYMILRALWGHHQWWNDDFKLSIERNKNYLLDHDIKGLVQNISIDQ